MELSSTHHVSNFIGVVKFIGYYLILHTAHSTVKVIFLLEKQLPVLEEEKDDVR